MTVPASKVLANKRYRAKTYDTIGFDVKKGKRDEYKAAAAELGLSLAALLTNAADEFIQRHAGQNFSVQTITAQPTEKISPTQRRLLDAVEKLPADAQKSLLKFLESLNKANEAENIDKRADIP